MTDVSDIKAVATAVPQAIYRLGCSLEQGCASEVAVDAGQAPGKPEVKACPAEAPAARGVRKDHRLNTLEW